MSNETPLSPEAEKLAAARKRNLDLALSQIQKDFGENAIMQPWRQRQNGSGRHSHGQPSD